MMRLLVHFLCVFCMLASACAKAADAGTAHVAVAANFKPMLDVLEADFEAHSDYEIEAVIGSTGGLYAQILQGAPFDVFLAADQTRPQKLEEAGHAIAGTRFTYAVGQLVLWTPDAEFVSLEDLKNPNLHRLAIANPDLAPYGMAARDVLERLGLWGNVQDKFVLGENIGQTFAFVKTGNAELGMVAFSQVLSLPEAGRGAYWNLESALYNPIRQDALLLKYGEDNAAAQAFLDFLKSEEAIKLIESRGYLSP